MIEIVFNNKAKKNFEDHQKSENKWFLEKMFEYYRERIAMRWGKHL